MMTSTDNAAPQLTLLWGTWELWCDLPSNASTSVNVESTRSNTHLVSDGDNWLNQVKSIGLFDSAEGFWGVHNCTVPPSRLPPNSSYYLFRKHIAPMWEHEANRRGGKWVIAFTLPSAAVGNSNHANNADTDSLLPVDVAWQRLCLAAIGEMFPCGEEEICGLTVSRSRSRQGKTVGAAGVEEWKVCVWTRNAEDEAAQMNVARFIGELLGSDSSVSQNQAHTHTDGDDGQHATDLSVSDASPTKADEGVESFATPLKSKSLNVSADGATPTPFKVRADSASASKLAIAYLAHRELMELKQRRHAKGTPGGLAFGPKYIFSV